jgi:peptidylprolyl isomerase
MKMSAVLILAMLPAAAQTATPAKSPASTPAKPAVRRTGTTTAKAGCYADMPALSPKIPKITGCPKVMYAERYVDITVGTGELAEPRKFYTVDYTGYLADGTVFDTSVGKKPITFPQGAGRVIPGFDTAFEGMHIGGKRRVFIPYEIAYGPIGIPKNPARPGDGIPPKSMLVFDLNLLSISDTPPAPPKPPTPPAPPAGSQPEKPATPATPAAPGTTTPPPTTPAAPPAQPGSAQNVVGKPTVTTPATPATDPTKPTAAPATPPKPQKP